MPCFRSSHTSCFFVAGAWRRGYADALPHHVRQRRRGRQRSHGLLPSLSFCKTSSGCELKSTTLHTTKHAHAFAQHSNSSLVTESISTRAGSAYVGGQQQRSMPEDHPERWRFLPSRPASTHAQQPRKLLQTSPSFPRKQRFAVLLFSFLTLSCS